MLTARDVARSRLMFLAVVRLLSLIGPLIGAIAMVSWLIEGFIDGDLFNFYYYSGRILTTIIGMGVPVVAWVFGPRIVRWLVPVAGLHRCPQCNHPATDSLDRCTECGLRFD